MIERTCYNKANSCIAIVLVNINTIKTPSISILISIKFSKTQKHGQKRETANFVLLLLKKVCPKENLKKTGVIIVLISTPTSAVIIY